MTNEPNNVNDCEKTDAGAAKRISLSVIIVKVLPFTKHIFNKFPWLEQFVDFSTVGVINLILSNAIYIGCVYIGIYYQISNQISYWLSVLNGYILNKLWVFSKQSSKKSPAQAIKYFAVYGFNFVLGIFLLWLYVDVLHISKYLAPIVSIPITIPLNYCLNRFWVFKKNKKQPSASTDKK